MHTNVRARLAEAISKFHDHVAISDSGRQLSYQELGASIDSVVARISAAGIPPCSRIALIIEDRTTAVSAILGAIFAGHTYIPLDINDPDERLRFILQDSTPALLLTDAGQAVRTRQFAGGVVPVVDLSETSHVADVAAGCSLEQLQLKRKCGTSCGSCVPELKRLAASNKQVAAA